MLELILVLFILMLTLSLSVPSFNRLIKDQQLQVESNQLAWTLRTARQEAMYGGQARSVKFYPGSNSYVFEKTRYTLGEEVEFAGVPTFPTRIGSIPACTFLSSGIPQAGGTVALTNSFEKKRYIIVNPVAGRVRVSSQPPQNW